MELHVRACSARNLRNERTFSTQDPYCKLSLRGKSFKTQVHDNGGGHDACVERGLYIYPQLDQLVVKVTDKSFTSKTLLGECRLPVSMFLSGSVVDQWFSLNIEDERAGEINLRVKLEGLYVQTPVQAYHASSYASSSYQSSQYPDSNCYPPSRTETTAVVAAVAVTSASRSNYDQQPPQYSQPPSGRYAQTPPPQYAQPPPQYTQPPPQYEQYPPHQPEFSYGYPPPGAVAYAVGPPVMVSQGGSPYAPRRYESSDSGGNSPRGGLNTTQVAVGVGAGVLGGVLLSDALEDAFD